MGQFIGRETWLQRFEGYRRQHEGTIWRIYGQPGIGKSSLLHRFACDCEAARHANSWLDMDSLLPQHGLDVLVQIAGSARYFEAESSGKPLSEKLGGHLQSFGQTIVGGLELGQSLIPAGQLLAGGARLVLALASGLAGQAAQRSEQQAEAHPEACLLAALTAAAQQGKRPVLLIDTFEHLLKPGLMLHSALLFHDPATVRESGSRPQPAARWLLDVCAHLVHHGWRVVIAGRDLPGASSPMQECLPPLTAEDILTAARLRPALACYLPEQEQAILRLLQRLAFNGNPLWLHMAMNLLEHQLEEGADLSALAAEPDVLQQRFEQDDPFDTGIYAGIEHSRSKLQLLATLTRAMPGLDAQAWKIALPRHLDMKLLACLLPANQARAIVHQFKIAGAFRSTGSQFSLHEEIRDLLLAHARHEGRLESKEARKAHRTLADVFDARWQAGLPEDIRSRMGELMRRDVKNLQNELKKDTTLARYAQSADLFDACYHRCLSLAGIGDGSVTPQQFWQALSGSVSLTGWEKKHIIHHAPEFSQQEIDHMLRTFADWQQYWGMIFGTEVSEAMKQYEQAGHPGTLHDVSFWQQRIEDYGLAGDYFGLLNVLHNTNGDAAWLIRTVDDMLARYGDSDEAAVQEQCTTALYNKGVTLRNSLNDPTGEVEEYDAWLARYGDSEEAVVQELCAKALYFKGVTLGEKLNDPAGEVATYDALLARYGDSELAAVQKQCSDALYNKALTMGNRLNDPAGAVAVYDAWMAGYGDSHLATVQEQCARAMVNKGWTLGEKLNDPAGEVAVYDALLARYGDSELAAVQKQCAKALFFKGVTLGNRLNDPAGEVAVYDALLARYGDSELAAVQERCANALYNKGWTLGERLNDPAGAVAVYDALLTRYGDSELAAVQERCAKTLYNKGVTLRNSLNDPAGAVAVYDTLLARYGDSELAAVQEQCANALYNKGWTLGERLNDPAGAVAVYDTLLARYGDSELAAVQEQCAKALFFKGVTLGNSLNDPAGAVAVYDALLARYGDSELPEVQRQCRLARGNLGELLLAAGDEARAIPLLRQTQAENTEDKEYAAIMPFLRWLAGDAGIGEVMDAIHRLDGRVTYDWNWSDIRPCLARQSEARRALAERFIHYFSADISLAELQEACLRYETSTSDDHE